MSKNYHSNYVRNRPGHQSHSSLINLSKKDVIDAPIKNHNLYQNYNNSFEYQNAGRPSYDAMQKDIERHKRYQKNRSEADLSTFVSPSYNMKKNRYQNIPQYQSISIYQPAARQRGQKSIMSNVITNVDQLNQYSYLKKYRKLDRFLDMEEYFKNLYGQKKQKRLLKLKQIQEEKQNLILKQKQKQRLMLPPIYQKKYQNMEFQKELLKVKLQAMEQRLNKIQPTFMIDYSRLPSLYNNGYCGNCSPQKHPNQNYNGQNSSKSLSNQNNFLSKNNTKFTKQQKKRLLSKFRIYGYVVFFTVLFPHYSLLFSHFKLKDFLQKYLIQGNKQIRSMNGKLIQKLKQIPIYQQIRIIHEQYEQQQQQLKKNTKNQPKKQIKSKLNSQQKLNDKKQQDPKIKISNQETNQNYMINLNILKRIILHVINIFSEIVKEFDQEIYQFIGVGSLNTSYIGDQIFSIEELPFLHFHPEKGNLVLNKQQQKALLLSCFFIKKVVYQYLVRLAIDQEWYEELASISQLKKKQKNFFKLICKQLELTAYFLYELAVKSFYTMIQSQNFSGNVLEQNDISLPLPLKIMKFPSLFMSKSQKQIYHNGFESFSTKKFMVPAQSLKSINNPSQESLVNFGSSYSFSEPQKQIFEQFNILIKQDPLNLIHNTFQYGQLSKIMGDYMNSSYQKSQKSILKIIQTLYQKVKNKRKANYKKIKQKVFKKKNILTKEHQILQGIMFLRNSQQKKEVLITRKMLELYMRALQNNQNFGADISSRRNMIKQDRQKRQSLMTKSNKSFVSFVTGSQNSG